MHRCINPDGTSACFWADYDPDTGERKIVEEPDFLGMKNPKGTPPMRRTMQRCGQGRNEWRAFAVMGHNCPRFEDFNDRNDRAEKLKKTILENKKKSFTGKTERFEIPDKSDMFYYLTVMVEDSKLAYDWLMDVYMAFGDADMDGVLSFFAKLNDMNIRGRQIDVIVDQWFNKSSVQRNRSFNENFEKFLADLKDDARGVVEHINQYFDKSDTEEAVIEGAALFGHKPLMEVVPRTQRLKRK